MTASTCRPDFAQKPRAAQELRRQGCSRRTWLAHAAAGALGAAWGSAACQGNEPVTDAALQHAAEAPLLHLGNVKQPLVIRSLDLLHQSGEFLVRVRSQDSA